MKVIRILSLLLALLMMFSLTLTLAAASTESETDTETDAADATDEEAVQAMDIVVRGQTEYVIVRDYKAGPKLAKAISELQLAFKTYLNCDIKVVDCYSDREVEEEVAPQAKEILIGSTNRPESAEAIDGKKVGDYAISISGEKVVIVGGSDDATALAVTRFLTAYVQDQGNRFEVANTGAMLSMSIDPSTLSEYDMTAKYSYAQAGICGARIDSYLITYAGTGVMSDTYKAFAEEFQGYVYKQVGLDLSLKKDSQVVKADYKILIGNTTFTDKGLINALDEDEYYIGVEKTETGATVTILFGRAAYDTVMEIFTSEIMPSFSTPVNFHICSGFVRTNMS